MAVIVAREQIVPTHARRREQLVAAHVPYTRHIDQQTILTRNGHLLQVLKLDGFAFETADQSEINHRKAVRETLLRGIADTHYSINYHIIRRRMTGYPDGEFASDFARTLDDTWRNQLGRKRLYVNDHYLTVVRRNASDRVNFAADMMAALMRSRSDDAHKEGQLRNIRALTETVDNLVTGLGGYGTRRLRCYRHNNTWCSEPLEFLHELINGKPQRVIMPAMDLAGYLPSKRLIFGTETLEIRGPEREDVTLAAMVSIKDYEAATAPGMIDHLLRLPFELVMAQSFSFMARQATLNAMNRTRAQLRSADEGAVTLMAQLDEAIDAVASGNSVFGQHHFTVMPKAPDQKSLDEAVSAIMGELAHIGMIAVREDINMEPAFWGQLPGNHSYITRSAAISVANFASFASFHNFPQGRADGNHWGSAVTLLETTSATPYHFSFHHHDLGNFTVIGPSGTGKTVIMTFLMAQAQRLKPRCFFFDKDRGAEIFVRAIGGSYAVLDPGKPSGFNPLQLPDTPANRAFLKSWLSHLLRSENAAELDAAEADIVSQAVDANYRQAPELRRLRYLIELFSGHERESKTGLAARLGRWCLDGERAWLFDNEDDTLNLSLDTHGFDITHILNDPPCRTSALMYLFHRIEQKLDGTRSIIMLDEGWRLLDDPVFVPQIKDWLKTIRKKNGIVGFATQSAKDAINSGIGDSIIEQCPTQIFMPNHKADEQAYRDGFGLTEEELRLVRMTDDASRCFLLKHGTHSVLARLDLSGLDDIIAVLSGRAETVALLDTIRAETGDDPDTWLPRFYEERRAQ